MLLHPYSPTWVDDYKAITSAILSHIDCHDLQCHHIGSTAIAGLAAKPIIDIDLSYSLDASFSIIKEGLESIGYKHIGNLDIVGREVFKRVQGEHHLVLDSIVHHLYLCHIDNKELQRHLAFRNYLRKNQEAKAEYEKLKYKIAELTDQDKTEYSILKETMARQFIEDILEKSHSAEQ